MMNLYTIRVTDKVTLTDVLKMMNLYTIRVTDKVLLGVFTQLFFKKLVTKSKRNNEYPIKIVGV